MSFFVVFLCLSSEARLLQRRGGDLSLEFVFWLAEWRLLSTSGIISEASVNKYNHSQSPTIT